MALLAVLVGAAAADATGRAPDVEMRDSAGRRIRLAAFEGKVVLVDLWASWCTSCTVLSLPVVLPGAAVPERAGVIVRRGDAITVIPDPAARLHVADHVAWRSATRPSAAGAPVTDPWPFEGVLAVGSLRLQVDDVGEGASGRRFLTVWDEDHPALRNMPDVETYPIDPRWRVAARFEAFDAPKPIQLGDVQGGTLDQLALGQLVFFAGGRQRRLTAIGAPGGAQLLVMFKDTTNGSFTYGGYRNVVASAVGDREWTVLDFNLAANPPCAYSPYTLCPLPPAENRIEIPVEADETRYAGAGAAVR